MDCDSGVLTLLSAIELSVFSQLANGPLSAGALIGKLRLHQRSVRDFLDALVALGMLNREDDRYANTPATDSFLDRNKPTYVGGLLETSDCGGVDPNPHVRYALPKSRGSKGMHLPTLQEPRVQMEYGFLGDAPSYSA